MGYRGCEWVRSPTFGFLQGVPVSFGNLVVDMDFLIVPGSPFEIIIETLTLEELMDRIDLGNRWRA